MYIILPECSNDEISEGLRIITKAIHDKKLAFEVYGGLGGEFGYGRDYENEVFKMHPYCWCDSEECKWCGEREKARLGQTCWREKVMAAISSDNWKCETFGEASDYGWKSYNCGCKMAQPERPNYSTYVNWPCPIHKDELKIKMNRAQRRKTGFQPVKEKE